MTGQQYATEAIESALERVLASDTFHKSSNLRHLLHYLVTKTLEGHPEQIKESIVAIDVFSRREDFDGRLDNIVRVQAHRLRKLLETYYLEEGKAEKLRFSIPKGSYVPQFETVAEESIVGTEPDLEIAVSAVARPAPRQPPPPASVRRSPLMGLFFSFMAGALLSALFLYWIVLPQGNRSSDVPADVREIWGGVFEPGVKVIASYSNPAFLRVEHTPLFLLYSGPLSAPAGAEFDPGANDPYVNRQLIPKGQKLHFSDGWTGTGEVLAVNRLTLLGAKFHNAPSVVPSRMLRLNEMHDANVIFIGSPSVNGALAEIGFKSKPFYSTSDGRIMIRNPRLGEASSYSNLLNQQTGEVIAGYVLFSVLPGLDGLHIVVSSSGLSTIATWVGVDYTTSAPGAAQLTVALKAVNGGKLPRFYQAIVRADFIRGVASKTTLVTVRPAS